MPFLTGSLLQLLTAFSKNNDIDVSMPFLTGSLLQLGLFKIQSFRKCFYALFNGQSVATIYCGGMGVTE